jgi:YD repeat-containing protein
VLSGEFATWSADFTTIENAVIAETAARINADLALEALIPTTESIQDLIGTFLVAGANITLTYDDPGNVLTVAATGGGGDFDTILTADGEVLVDAEGNVLAE